MENRHLSVKTSFGFLVFEGFEYGFPVLTGSVRANLAGNGIKANYIQAKIMLSYDPVFEAFDLMIHYGDNVLCCGLTFYGDAIEHKPFLFPKPGKSEGHVCGPAFGQSYITGSRCMSMIRGMYYTIRKIRPFSWKIYPKMRDDMKDKIRFLFFVFHRLFKTFGVRLPEEMMIQILINLDVITS